VIYTYQQIAKELGVSHQRVKQIEVAALFKIRNILIKKGILKDHLL
jgi:DNA-directed RNA polymerase sigma subunit (sigma70/sigma32)